MLCWLRVARRRCSAAPACGTCGSLSRRLLIPLQGFYVWFVCVLRSEAFCCGKGCVLCVLIPRLERHVAHYTAVLHRSVRHCGQRRSHTLSTQAAGAPALLPSAKRANKVEAGRRDVRHARPNIHCNAPGRVWHGFMASLKRKHVTGLHSQQGSTRMPSGKLCARECSRHGSAAWCYSRALCSSGGS